MSIKCLRTAWRQIPNRFGILSSVFAIFQYCKYRHRYRYFKISDTAWAETYLHTKWHLNPSIHLVTTDMGRKLGAVPLGEGELGPHLTQCGQSRGLPSCQFHFDPSNRLATIHQRHRQTGQDKQRSDSIGRTVFQMVAQKRVCTLCRKMGGVTET